MSWTGLPKRSIKVELKQNELRWIALTSTGTSWHDGALPDIGVTKTLISVFSDTTPEIIQPGQINAYHHQSLLRRP